MSRKSRAQLKDVSIKSAISLWFPNEPLMVTYRMPNNVHPALAIKPWVSGTPKPIRLVGLNTDGFNHGLTMLRHEQGDIEQDRIGDLPNGWDFRQGNVGHGEPVIKAVLNVFVPLFG